MSSFTAQRLAAEVGARLERPLTTNAVYRWLSGRVRPSSDAMEAIVAASGGTVTAADIIRHRYEMERGDGANEGAMAARPQERDRRE